MDTSRIKDQRSKINKYLGIAGSDYNERDEVGTDDFHDLKMKVFPHPS